MPTDTKDWFSFMSATQCLGALPARLPWQRQHTGMQLMTAAINARRSVARDSMDTRGIEQLGPIYGEWQTDRAAKRSVPDGWIANSIPV